MHDAKELIRASSTYAHENRLLSWWHLWSTVGMYSLLVTFVCLDLPMVIRALASILSGLVLVRLFILYHDYQHGAILKGSPIAALVMWAYGLVALNPPSIWSRSHNHHHKTNAKIFGANIGSYPLMTTKMYAHASRRERFHYAVSRHPLTIALGYFTVFLYGMCLRSLLVNPRKHFDSAVALLLHILLILSLAMVGCDVLLLVLMLPFLIAAGLGAYLFYAQHNFPDVTLRDGADWSYVFAALHSSSFIKMSRLMHWFTGNIGYHHVHHLNARIPFYRLPEAMAGIEALQSPGTTSLHPYDVASCLRLKLWDPEQNRLVTFIGT